MIKLILCVFIMVSLSMSGDFKAGDIVRLKSGGPQMTVYRVDSSTVRVVFYGRIGVDFGYSMQYLGFSDSVLVHVDDEE